MNAQITFTQVLNSKTVMQRFKGLPMVAVIENGINILTDYLQLLSTHKVCFDLLRKKAIKKYAVLESKNTLVVYI